MCRADLTPEARQATAQLLTDLRQALADQADVPPDSIRIGPVDLGPTPETSDKRTQPNTHHNHTPHPHAGSTD